MQTVFLMEKGIANDYFAKNPFQVIRRPIFPLLTGIE